MMVIIDDGGRKAAGYLGGTGDCVCRAIAIATERPYGEIYDELARLNAGMRKTARRSKTVGTYTAARGIYTRSVPFRRYMASLGFTWTPTMAIGTGCRVHLRRHELPKQGRLVVMVSKHATAVIDGVLFDTHDPTRGGTRCVYGYWSRP